MGRLSKNEKKYLGCFDLYPHPNLYFKFVVQERNDCHIFKTFGVQRDNEITFSGGVSEGDMQKGSFQRMV